MAAINNFFRNTSIYILSSILNASIPFVLLPFLTRLLTPKEYGEIAMFNLIVSAIIALFSLSIPGAASRKFFDDISKKDLAIFIGDGIKILLTMSSISLILLLIFYDNFIILFGISGELILLANFVGFFNILIQLRLTQWQVRQKSISYGLLQIMQSLISFSITLFLILWIGLKSEGRILAIIITSAFFGCLCFYYFLKNQEIKLQPKPVFINEILRFGVPLIPHLVGLYFLRIFDRFIVNNEISIDAAGIFMVGIQISLVLQLLFTAINKAYMPWLFSNLKKQDNTINKNIVRYTYFWFLLLLLLAILNFLITPSIVYLLVGEKFYSVSEIVPWLFVAQILQGMYLMVSNYIFFSRKTMTLSIISISTGLLYIFSTIFLIRFYGLLGVCYSAVIIGSIRFLITWIIAAKVHKMPWINLKND